MLFKNCLHRRSLASFFLSIQNHTKVIHSAALFRPCQQWNLLCACSYEMYEFQRIYKHPASARLTHLRIWSWFYSSVYHLYHFARDSRTRYYFRSIAITSHLKLHVRVSQKCVPKCQSLCRNRVHINTRVYLSLGRF